MTQEEIAEHKHLWDGSEPGWVLVGQRGLSIFNVLTSMDLLIEDNELLSAVKEAMAAHGVPILNSGAEIEALKRKLTGGEYPNSES